MAREYRVIKSEVSHPADWERGGRTRPPKGKEPARRGAGGSLSTRPSVVTLHTPE